MPRVTELLTHAELAELRLRRFVSRVRTVENWEYEDELWVGEAYGFTEVLRLQREPKVVRSVAIDLAGVSERVQTRLLNALRLPLHRGMTLKPIVGVLGKPKRKSTFASDRTTYDFHVGKAWPYEVSCTVLEKGGLIYLTVMVGKKP